MLGSPDSYRTEGSRGSSLLDDAYTDGISFTTYSPTAGRSHVATFGAGLSYPQRLYGYYQGGNCIAHDGAELPPAFLNKEIGNTFCDTSLRGGYGSNLETTLTLPSDDDDPYTISVLYFDQLYTTAPLTPATTSPTTLTTALTCAIFNDQPELNVTGPEGMCTTDSLASFKPQLVPDKLEPRVTELADGTFRITFTRVIDPTSSPITITSSDTNVATLADSEPVPPPNSRNCMTTTGAPNTCTSNADCATKGCYEYFQVSLSVYSHAHTS